MKTTSQNLDRGSSEETDAAQPFGKTSTTQRLVIAACFLAGGWALLDSGHTYWGVATLVIALMTPIFFNRVERYQQRYPALAQAKRDRETERLIEMARREIDGIDSQRVAARD